MTFSFVLLAACAKIKFLRIWSSNENKGFIVAEEDSTFIQFEVSGGNSVHSFKGVDGPEFYYTTTDGVSYKGCSGFEPSNGSCLTRKGVRDACSCEMLTSNMYRLSYTKTATLDTSGATVYLLWPGTPDLRSDNYTFPEIRASRSFSDIVYTSLFIGVGLVLLATVTGAGVIYYSQYGDAEDNNFHALLGTGLNRVRAAARAAVSKVQRQQENE
ncbi:hypothetical protein RRG08_041321 [Elysia crispata]|uniref:Autophagy-related protein 27 n=1 Tax=Elysia crispata TaxID=231223 RepID=A0AAE0YTK8_9GAST|nr:hypothetical protein RRG08_041321 [Elysia crispata]